MASLIRTVEPEQHFISPTPYVPNPRFSVLVYRNVFQSLSPEGMLQHIEANNWLKGGRWKAFKTAHFHSNTHECYAVLKGKTTYSLGKSPIDTDLNEEGKENGIKLRIGHGGFFVLSAGVSRCSIESEEGYEYIGFYPKDFPKWNMNYCKDAPEKTKQKAIECHDVPIPDNDPVYGTSGPLLELWQAIDKEK